MFHLPMRYIVSDPQSMLNISTLHRDLYFLHFVKATQSYRFKTMMLVLFKTFSLFCFPAKTLLTGKKALTAIKQVKIAFHQF